jgi:hypothetical protein
MHPKYMRNQIKEQLLSCQIDKLIFEVNLWHVKQQVLTPFSNQQVRNRQHDKCCKERFHHVVCDQRMILLYNDSTTVKLLVCPLFNFGGSH